MLEIINCGRKTKDLVFYLEWLKNKNKKLYAR
jgi:hypothetical protein